MTGAAQGRGFTALALVVAAAALALLILMPLGAAWALAPDLGHGWAAPILIGYLYWERWRERPAVRQGVAAGPAWWIGAVVLAAVALPLQLLLAPYPLWPALVWAYTALLVGIALAGAGLMGGSAGVRWLGSPLIILIGALPWLTEINQSIIFPLRGGIADVAAEVCNAFGRPALAFGTTVYMGGGWVGVDEACGGIRSLQAAVMIALFFGEWLRFPWLRRAALILIGMAAALLGNFLRIVFLALEAARGAAAFTAAHDPAGWLALAISLALTGFAAWRWARRRPGAAAGAAAGLPGGDARPAAAWLCAVAGLLFLDAAFVHIWFARGDARNAEIPHWVAKLPADALEYRDVPLPEASREMLLPDAYAAGTWRDGEGKIFFAYYVEWHRGTVARFIPFLHNPTVCLPTAGCELEKSLGVISVHWSGGQMPFHAYLFRRAGQELAVAFTIWDTARDRPLERPAVYSTWADWFRANWEDVREARRFQPAQLLSIAISGKGAREELGPALEQLIVRP